MFAFISYVGAGLDGTAGLGDFNLQLDDDFQGKVVKGCPSYEDVRQPSMDNFDLKKYQGKWYAGVITECNVCATSGDHIWRVKYDDDDISDYNARQLQEIFVGDLGEILE